MLNQHRILVPDIMLQQVTDELTPTSTTDIILTFEPDSIASSLNLIEGEKSAEVQPDLSYDLDGNLNSRVSIMQIFAR